jgi:hypothetical protein
MGTTRGSITSAAKGGAYPAGARLSRSNRLSERQVDVAPIGSLSSSFSAMAARRNASSSRRVGSRQKPARGAFVCRSSREHRPASGSTELVPHGWAARDAPRASRASGFLARGRRSGGRGRREQRVWSDGDRWTGDGDRGPRRRRATQRRGHARALCRRGVRRSLEAAGVRRSRVDRSPRQPLARVIGSRLGGGKGWRPRACVGSPPVQRGRCQPHGTQK